MLKKEALGEAKPAVDGLRFALTGSLLTASVLGLALFHASCSGSLKAQELRQITAAPPAPVKHLFAELEDEVRNIPGNRIHWSTYWKLCWEKYPEAVGYELQIATSEGVSKKLRRQSEQCLRVEVAAGENERSRGLVNRELQLTLATGQLAYRVRAVLKDNRTSEWSPLMEAGQTQITKPQRRTRRNRSRRSCG